MQVTPSTFTIAEYCQQMREKSIIVNHDYQRSDKVWPPAARSYLIETILLGFPIPKLSLYQTTDLKTKKTKKEIVNGQQRSQAISDFLEGASGLQARGLSVGGSSRSSRRLSSSGSWTTPSQSTFSSGRRRTKSGRCSGA